LILAYVFDDLDAAGIPFKGGRGRSTKAHSAVAFTRTSNLPMTSDTSRESSLAGCPTAYFSPGQPPNSHGGYRHLGELKALSRRNISFEE
jgi:hypothetical protein